MAGPPVEVQVRVKVGVEALSSEVNWNCTEETTTSPVEENNEHLRLFCPKIIFVTY